MNAEEFCAWRQGYSLTQEQVAQKFGVSRTTVQNWESGATPISPAVMYSCELWGKRLIQENPLTGPVTLVYADGPMFIDPYGPRNRPSMMQQVACQSNAQALAWVQLLWGRTDFHNPFVTPRSGEPLWNVVELERVVSGNDEGAPTWANILRFLATHAADPNTVFARKGPKMLSQTELEARQERMKGYADRLFVLAETPRSAGTYREVEQVLDAIRKEGVTPVPAYVDALAQISLVNER